MHVNVARSQPHTPTDRRPPTRPARTRRSRAVWPGIALAAFLLGWEALVRLGAYPAFILPSPGRVARRFVAVALDGTLWHHVGVTLAEVLGGLALGLSVATALGYLLAKSVTIERALSPYIVASQAIPIVAIAPLLVIWFGPGLTSKILISALIVFFPILINTVAGVRSVPQDLRDLMRSLHATPWQVFAKLEVPGAMPVLLAGLKVGATLSVIGAVVGEFAGADAGLGFMINLADGQFDTARVFVGVFVLAALALALYGIVTLIECRALAWRRAGNNGHP
jgi:NitT/TauT family transport system permease protein